MGDDPRSNPLLDFINGGIKVKGEDEALEEISKLFEPEEEIVEREIKQSLSATPEEKSPPLALYICIKHTHKIYT